MTFVEGKALDRRTFLVGGMAAAALGLSACAPQTKGETLSSTRSSEGGVAWTDEADVVIIGAGGAGLMAAAAAHENGASSIVLESQPMAGGDTFTCGCFVTAPWPEHYKKPAGADLGDEEYKAQWKEDYALTRPYSNFALAGKEGPEESPLSDRQLELTSEMFQWTADVAGIEWVNWDECEWFPGAEGTLFSGQFLANNRVIPSLSALIDGYDDAEVVLNTEAYDIVMENGRAVGVLASENGSSAVAIKARRGVVIATGSFTNGTDLVGAYMPENKGFPTMSTAGIMGGGHKMAERVGGKLRDMDLGMHWFCASYGSSEQNSTLATVQAMHGGEAGSVEGILVNYDGKRFVNEAHGYSHTGLSTAKQPYQSSYYVVDSNGIALLPVDDPAYLVKRADTLEELAMRMGVNEEAFLAEVARYNGFVDAGTDEDFGKPMNCPKIETAPFYALPMYPRPYVTYGGIQTDVDSHVLNARDEIIPGLYAAGLCTGSYGAQEGYFYPGGLGQALVFGRQAGRLAATEEAA